MRAEALHGKRILVTGCAGFIGSHLSEFLLSLPEVHVIGVDNLCRGSKKNIQHLFSDDRFVFIEADINDTATMEAVVKETEMVLHQAALGSVNASVENPLLTHQANATGFLSLLEACRKQKVQKIVYASSSSVYGDNGDSVKNEISTGKPLSPYAVTKQCDELYASVYSSLFGMNIIGLRYFNIFGPRQNPRGPYAAAIPVFITRILKKEKIQIYGDGLQSRDFTYIDNAIQANILALLAPPTLSGEVFNVACGHTITLIKILELICQELKADPEVEYLPPRRGDIRYSLASIEKASRLLGYIPHVGVEEGIRRTVQWYKENYDSFY